MILTCGLTVLADSSVAKHAVSADAWTMVSALSAAVAAVAAWRATANALRSDRAQMHLRKAEKLGGYYEKMVAEPIMHVLDGLKHKASELTAPAVVDITKLCDVDAAQTAVRSRVQRLIDDFDAEFQALRDVVTTVIGAWGDLKCNAELRAELENLEDTVKQEMAMLALDQQDPDVRRVIVRGTARFYATIMKHDPTLGALATIKS